MLRLISPDPRTQEELTYLLRQEEFEQKKIETALKKHELDQRKSEHDQRVGYARKIFILISLWLLTILLILIAAGSDCKFFYLHLSDRVLITLLTTTNSYGVRVICNSFKIYFWKKVKSYLF